MTFIRPEAVPTKTLQEGIAKLRDILDRQDGEAALAIVAFIVKDIEEYLQTHRTAS